MARSAEVRVESFFNGTSRICLSPRLTLADVHTIELGVERVNGDGVARNIFVGAWHFASII
jgi:hypothetical protein